MNLFSRPIAECKRVLPTFHSIFTDRSSCLRSISIGKRLSQGLSSIASLLLLFPASLAAYQPTRWSPMNLYVENAVPNGPQAIEVLDAQGVLLARAEYSYTAKGQLHRERYRDADGKLQGDTVYKYGNYGIVEEKLFNSSGKLLSRVQFLYDAKKRLESMHLLGATDEVKMVQRYRYENGRLIGGVEENGERREYFRFQYEKERLTALIIRDERQKRIAKISYRYNRKGQLHERIRLHDRQVSRCLYHYNAEGKIASYTYYEQIGGQRDGKDSWRKTKVLNFFYSGRAQSDRVQKQQKIE